MAGAFGHITSVRVKARAAIWAPSIPREASVAATAGHQGPRGEVLRHILKAFGSDRRERPSPGAGSRPRSERPPGQLGGPVSFRTQSEIVSTTKSFTRCPKRCPGHSLDLSNVSGFSRNYLMSLVPVAGVEPATY